MTRPLLPLTVLAAALLAGCSGTDGPAPAPEATTPAPAPSATTSATASGDFDAACTSFAEYIQAGQPGDGSAVDDERTNAVRDVSGLLGSYDDAALQDARDGLVSALNTSDAEWSAAADTFAQACFDAGWEG